VAKVIVEPDESFESALKRFKKQCGKAGLLSEFKKRLDKDPEAEVLPRRKEALWRLRLASEQESGSKNHGFRAAYPSLDRVTCPGAIR
jgi:small subunit ribosomal protein S21